MTYGSSDGLDGQPDERSIFEGHDGQLYVVTGIHNRNIRRFDGNRFVSVAPMVPGHDSSWDWSGWGWGQIHLQDHLGEWWFATGQGLLRYPKVKRLEDLAHTPPKAWYRDLNDVFRLYEDSRGDIWIGNWRGASQLARWERSTRRFRYQQVGAPGDWVGGMPTAFREDRVGNLWIGRWERGLVRYRKGRFEWIFPEEKPTGTILSLFLDHAGQMWVGTSRGGLLRFDDPAAEHPGYRVYSTKDGLSSNEVRAITEDRFWRIYFWTGRGVDRLNPDAGGIRHYTETDGVSVLHDISVAFCDHNGSLWFGPGLWRLDPEPDKPAQPPPIRITNMRIRGRDHPVSELGETDLSGLVLQPSQDQLQIDFASLHFDTSNTIKYQYKLEGADDDWNTPGDLRSVNYPRLPSGRYRFLVRAVNTEGLVSTIPATITFRLLPPLWLRWWFLTAAGMLLACLIYWAYRFRLQQLLELERVRTRIASDLHDDIGSSLTQIAIMNEVVRRRGGHSADLLERIAGLSRELVDSMSDIVWAINPKRDQLSDLIQRMRRFANDVLEPTDIEVSFRVLPEHSNTPMHADMRRELFLIFKESLNNIARHAWCGQVDIFVEVDGSQLSMRINDDGEGFQSAQEDGHGHGLISMRDRARRLGGDITAASERGKGTTLMLNVPLDHIVLPAHRPSLHA